MIVGRKKQNNSQEKKSELLNTDFIKNARDVSRVIQDKKTAQIEHFIRVLQLCQIEIFKCVDLGYTHCIFEVPSFLVGYPLFDLNECIVFILRKLQENEYHVSYYFPKTIYITWLTEESNEDKINNRFLDILEGIKRKHEFQGGRQFDNNSLIDPQHLKSPIKFDDNSTFQRDQINQHQRFREIPNHNTYLPASKIDEIHKWSTHSSDPFQEKTKEISNITEKKTKDKSNEKDEMKRMLNDPFYLIDKAKAQQVSPSFDAMSLKSKRSNSDNHNNNPNPNPNPETTPKNNPLSKKKDSKKKEVKPISDLKDKKKFVLDLS